MSRQTIAPMVGCRFTDLAVCRSTSPTIQIALHDLSSVHLVSTLRRGMLVISGQISHMEAGWAAITMFLSQVVGVAPSSRP